MKTNQTYFLDNVEQWDASHGEDDTNGNEGGVESGEQNGLHESTVFESKVVLGFFVERVQLALSHELLLCEECSVDDLEQAPTISDQRRGSEKRIRNEDILLIEDQTTYVMYLYER